MILVNGCSFFGGLYDELVTRFKDPHIKNLAMGGAGNDWIAAGTIDAVMNYPNEIDYAFIMWSGIMRHDLEIGNNVFPTIISNDEYSCYSDNNRGTFIHSGGIGAGYKIIKNKTFKNYLDLYYHEYDNEFYTNRTLRNMFSTKCVLEANNIPYDFGFIYDPHKDDMDNLTVLGKASQDISKHYTIHSYPYNFCKDRPELMTDDKFHPTTQGIIRWLNSVNLVIDK